MCSLRQCRRDRVAKLRILPFIFAVNLETGAVHQQMQWVGTANVFWQDGQTGTAAAMDRRPGFFLPVRVLSRLFRRLFLEKLTAAHETGLLHFFGDHAHLHDTPAFAAYLAPRAKANGSSTASAPSAGPKLCWPICRATPIASPSPTTRLIAFDRYGVTFKWKDYRAKAPERQKIMTLPADEFIRRFLIHLLPSGFHRIRHYGLFASGSRADNLARARQPLAGPQPHDGRADTPDSNQPPLTRPCPCCGGRMIIIETFERGCAPRSHPTASMSAIRIDTSGCRSRRRLRPYCRISAGHGQARPMLPLRPMPPSRPCPMSPQSSQERPARYLPRCSPGSASTPLPHQAFAPWPQIPIAQARLHRTATPSRSALSSPAGFPTPAVPQATSLRAAGI